MKESAKKVIRLILGEYSIYRIYAFSGPVGPDWAPIRPGFRFARLDEPTIANSTDTLIVDQRWWHGDDADAFGCFEESRPVAACFYWHGDRYRARGFWPLEASEAKLVQIVTVPDRRGLGLATDLIRYSAHEMLGERFHTLYARIWHSNTPSINAFRRAGWRHVATVTEVNPLRLSGPVRMTFRRRI